MFLKKISVLNIKIQISFYTKSFALVSNFQKYEFNFIGLKNISKNEFNKIGTECKSSLSLMGKKKKNFIVY